MTKLQFNYWHIILAAVLAALACNVVNASSATSPTCVPYASTAYNGNRSAVVGKGIVGCIGGGKFVKNDVTISLEYHSKYSGWQNGPYVRRVSLKSSYTGSVRELCGDIDGHRVKWIWRARIEGRAVYRVNGAKVYVPYSFVDYSNRTFVC